MAKQIGLIIAMKEEAEKLIAELKEPKVEGYKGRKFYLGSLKGVDVIIGICGIGKVSASHLTTVMCNRYNLSLIISTGLAGGLGKLPKLSVLIADGVVQHDFDITAFGKEKGQITGFDSPVFMTAKKETEILKKGIKNASSGIIATGDQFINSEEKRKEIVADFGAVACDMESGAVAQIASLEGVPCCIVRVISDDAGDGAEDDFYKLIEKASTLNSTLILNTIDKF